MSDRILLDAGTSGEDGPSFTKKVLTCIRRAGVEGVLGWPSGSSEPAIKGSIGHVGLAHYYRRMQARQQRTEDPDKWYPRGEAMELVAAKHPGWAKYVPDMKFAVEQYIKKYPNEEKEITILHVEAIGGLHMNDPLLGSSFMHTRQDLVYLHNRRRVVISRDHKFVAYPSRDHAEDYGRDLQFVFLMAAGMHYFGGSFGGAELNLIGSDGKRFMRFGKAELPAIPHRIRDLPQTRAWAKAQWDYWKNSGVHPTRWPAATHMHACRNRFERCPHRKTCDFYNRG